MEYKPIITGKNWSYKENHIIIFFIENICHLSRYPNIMNSFKWTKNKPVQSAYIYSIQFSFEWK